MRHTNGHDEGGEHTEIVTHNLEEPVIRKKRPVLIPETTNQIMTGFENGYEETAQTVLDEGTESHDDAVSEGSDHSQAQLRSRIIRSVTQIGKFLPGRVIRWHFDRALSGVDLRKPSMFMENFEAATLFADISGFTELAERLEKDKRLSTASKVLSTEVGLALEPLVEIVFKWGGDVIKFAGDAIFAIFTVQMHGDLATAAIAASVAAKQITNFLLFNARTKVTLKSHCGVGAGTLVGYHIGGVLNRWEYVIAGQSLDQAIKAEKEASKGDVIISPSVYQFTERICEAVPTANKFYRLTAITGEGLGGRMHQRTHKMWDELKKFDIDTLKSLFASMASYIPRPVVQAVDSGQSEWLADVRVCATLFVKLKGLKPDDVASVHNAVRIVQKRMYTFVGASLCRVIADDKGLGCLWAFGMPPNPIDVNDNMFFRAVVAALTLHEDLNENHLSCSAGLTAGRVFCGTVGHGLRTEYTLHGTQVNLAARLMGKAEDGILVDDNVFSATKDLISYEDPKWIEVKGKSEAIVVYRPNGILPSCLDILSAATRKGVPQAVFSQFHMVEDAHGSVMSPITTPAKLQQRSNSDDALRQQNKISPNKSPRRASFWSDPRKAVDMVKGISLFTNNPPKYCLGCRKATFKDRDHCKHCGSHRWEDKASGNKENKACALCGKVTSDRRREICKACGCHRWIASSAAEEQFSQ